MRGDSIGQFDFNFYFLKIAKKKIKITRRAHPQPKLVEGAMLLASKLATFEVASSACSLSLSELPTSPRSVWPS